MKGACNPVRQVEIRFAEENRRFTKQFERYARKLCRQTTINGAARHLGVSWDVVKDIQKRYLQRKAAPPRLKHLTQIAIDEITIGHEHRYLTLVLVMKSGAVVLVGEGRDADGLAPFCSRLGASRAKVEAAAAEMSAANTLNRWKTHFETDSWARDAISLPTP